MLSVLDGLVSVVGDKFLNGLHDDYRVNGAVEASVLAHLEAVEEKHYLRCLQVIVVLSYQFRTFLKCLPLEFVVAATELTEIHQLRNEPIGCRHSVGLLDQCQRWGAAEVALGLILADRHLHIGVIHLAEIVDAPVLTLQCQLLT